MTTANIRVRVLRYLEGVAPQLTPTKRAQIADDLASFVAGLAHPEPAFTPHVVSSIANVRCDGCARHIAIDGVAVQVLPAPTRPFLYFHRLCQPPETR